MNRRLAPMVALCCEAAMPVLVLACIAASGSVGIDSTGAATIVDRLAPALTASAKLPDTLPPIAASGIAIGNTNRLVTKASAVDAVSDIHEETIVTAALTDSSENLPPEASPKAGAPTSVAAPAPDNADRATDSSEDPHDCMDACINAYLWKLYQRAPKEDAISTHEQKTMTIRKKGKLVKVTKSFTTVADEDFSWKDPKAAENAGMPISDYVIGGMDRDFKLKLSHMLHAAEDAGLSPGITSAFRDDYRQSIASGLKAANTRSYHGGSLRGGYGHGLAADIVSVGGATRADRLDSSRVLWKWVDAHGKEFGIARPYLGRDPPHVAPIDGNEYAVHRLGKKDGQLASAATH